MREKNIKLSSIILLLIIMSLSSTYALLELSANNSTATGEAGCTEVNYEGTIIDNSSLVSTTNYLESVSSNITLSKNANCEIYTEASIYLHTNETDAPISNGAMKYRIMQGINYIASGVVKDETDQILTTVTLTDTPTVYTVYIWIDSSLSKGTYNSKTYSGYIYASSAQTSTINGKTIPNAPNLDSGNLIPVSFDESSGTTGSWVKADSSNPSNRWYDYENSMWANAVIVDPTKKSTYQSAAVGTVINDADIIAFYVWIPRYKYRVWNITRQGGAESTYAYPAYSTGIEINWENGTESTGNVECTYNIRSAESATNLSDTCIYNGTDTITTTSLNTNYTDAWYTHPAFTFGDGADKEKTGFWIGKFETSGTVDEEAEFWIAEAPTILPDVPALVNQYISEQFMTAKNFQNYLSNSVDAHMLTNLEWGAVTYLIHSIYGLCDGTSCQGLYINNSYGTSCYFTGRSGGAIAGSTDLNLANVYPDNSTKTTKYNCNGYYDYKGYFIDYDGNVTTTKDITKVASTTGNITGVYDMSGGAYDYVMGNMVSSSYAFYPSAAGTAWDGTSWYDTTNSALYSKYYNAYSYGTDDPSTAAFNRARLGDATAEVLGGNSGDSSWKIGSGITGANANFVTCSDSWFARGGNPFVVGSGPFDFHSFGGVDSAFRSSIS